MIKEQTSLYFSEGSSDKEYHAQIAGSGEGFVVNFQYGRRGSALAAGTKTASPVSFEAAKKAFDKLVKEKTAKGYTPDVSGSSYQGTEDAGRKTGFVPQLLNQIPEREAMRLIKDDNYAAQEKMDGERRAVMGDANGVTGMNRKGLSVPLPQAIADLLSPMSTAGNLLVDGEIIGETLYVFDLHEISGKDLRNKGWLERMDMACGLFAKNTSIRTVPVASTSAEKRALWNKVKAEHGEGVVFKLKTSQYAGGRPNSGGEWLKYKFTESASCHVLEINSGKRSVKLGLLDPDNPQTVDGLLMATVGNVTIPANYNIPSPGEIVEVEYLYAYKGGSLYQPVYRGTRTDIDPDACKISQLKFKPEARDEEGA